MRVLANTQETEEVARGILERSHGAIKTGVYHSDIADRQKLQLHKDWRDGRIQVVCATIGESRHVNVRGHIHML